MNYYEVQKGGPFRPDGTVWWPKQSNDEDYRYEFIRSTERLSEKVPIAPFTADVAPFGFDRKPCKFRFSMTLDDLILCSEDAKFDIESVTKDSVEFFPATLKIGRQKKLSCYLMHFLNQIRNGKQGQIDGEWVPMVKMAEVKEFAAFQYGIWSIFRDDLFNALQGTDFTRISFHPVKVLS